MYTIELKNIEMYRNSQFALIWLAPTGALYGIVPQLKLTQRNTTHPTYTNQHNSCD